MNTSDTRLRKIERLFAEILARAKSNESGEIYITWKGASVGIKFSHWLSMESVANLTNEQNR